MLDYNENSFFLGGVLLGWFHRDNQHLINPQTISIEAICNRVNANSKYIYWRCAVYHVFQNTFFFFTITNNTHIYKYTCVKWTADKQFWAANTSHSKGSNSISNKIKEYIDKLQNFSHVTMTEICCLMLPSLRNELLQNNVTIRLYF